MGDNEEAAVGENPTTTDRITTAQEINRSS